MILTNSFTICKYYSREERDSENIEWLNVEFYVCAVSGMMYVISSQCKCVLESLVLHQRSVSFTLFCGRPISPPIKFALEKSVASLVHYAYHGMDTRVCGDRLTENPLHTKQMTGDLLTQKWSRKTLSLLVYMRTFANSRLAINRLLHRLCIK